jgi:hypothetical protein
MLSALGALLGVINEPLNQMGTLMELNASSYVAATNLGSVPMSTVAFNVFAGPWIYYLGNMSVALGNFMVSLNSFLIAVAGAL